MTGTPALELAGVSKSFNNIPALLPLDLSLPEGELLAVLGPSGCGKTTTLRIIAGFEAPDAGTVRIGGRDVTRLPPNKRGLGMVFQNYSLFPHMTVAENVGFGLRMRGQGAAARAERVGAMLDLVRLGGTGDRGVHELSGGQQQRIALARALAPGPRILLLDEPLGALDKNLREGMQFELRQIQRRMGITSILVTHDQEEALTMSDRVAVMQGGRVVQSGPPTEVYDTPRTRFVAEFLGTANVLGGTVQGREGAHWVVDLAPGRGTVHEAHGTARAADHLQLAPGHGVSLAVRPERLRIGPVTEGNLVATVVDVVFRGSSFAYELRLPNWGGQELFAYTQDRVPAGPGDTVGLSWAPGAAVVLEDGL